MAANDVHHYVPRFLLDAWKSKDDGLVSAFNWVHGGKFVQNRYSPKGIASKEGLYAVNGFADKNQIETGFFTQVVDEPGADAYRAVMERTAELTETETLAWSKFVVSLMVRGPDTVADARARGAMIVKKLMEDEQERRKTVHGVYKNEISLAVFENALPHALSDMGPWAIRKVIDRPTLNDPILCAHWLTVDTSDASTDLMIGDKPIIYTGNMEEKFIVALPLTPTMLFLASNGAGFSSTIAACSKSQLVKNLNRCTVEQAMHYVYAAHDGHAKFVKKYLRQDSGGGQ